MAVTIPLFTDVPGFPTTANPIYPIPSKSIPRYKQAGTMDDGMNDDIAASRTTPPDQKQQKPGTTDRRLSDSHFQGFRRMLPWLLVNPSPCQLPDSLVLKSGQKLISWQTDTTGTDCLARKGRSGSTLQRTRLLGNTRGIRRSRSRSRGLIGRRCTVGMVHESWKG